MICGMFLFAGGDAMAKLLTSTIHPVQIIWFRQLGLLGGVVFLLVRMGPSIFQSRRPGLQIVRGVLVIGSSLLFVFAVRYVPLADAIAASFVAPFFATMLGAWLLKEQVSKRQWAAVTLGFIGAAIVVRPFMGTVHPAVLLVVVAAALFATRQVIGRLLADNDSTATTVAFTAISASLLISVPLPFVWVWPEQGIQWVWLLSMGFLAAIGEVLVIRALEVAQASVVAPMHYTIIIWGTLYGFVLFDQLPDIWTLLGTGIIVSTGLYTLRASRKQNAG